MYECDTTEQIWDNYKSGMIMPNLEGLLKLKGIDVVVGILILNHVWNARNTSIFKSHPVNVDNIWADVQKDVEVLS